MEVTYKIEVEVRPMTMTRSSEIPITFMKGFVMISGREVGRGPAACAVVKIFSCFNSHISIPGLCIASLSNISISQLHL